jgi:seryl-tRNA synthetase
MLDARNIRENFEAIKKNLEKRQQPSVVKNLEKWFAQDKEWKTLRNELDDLRASRNKITEEIKLQKASGKDISALLEKAKKNPERIKALEPKVKLLEEENKKLLMIIPNILDDSVPYGKDDTENKEVKKWGSIKEKDFEIKHHGQLAKDLGVAEFDRAVKISGEGFFVLKGELALMSMAIANYAIEMLSKKGFELVLPPYMMNRRAYEGVTDLGSFEDVMYKVENADNYLIATSEHPLIGLRMDEIVDEKELPIKLVGYSQCFRKEGGKHGLDERGLFRVHQFDKVEQIVICKPNESAKFHEALLANSEELLQGLEIPYRVVNVCTGDIGIIASKKYDIEAWSPREKKYFETHSLSNCSTYQAVRLNIRCRKEGSDTEKEYPHTLNATHVAIPRMLRAIIENHQTKEGTIKVPKVLQPYMHGIKEIKKKK